MKKSPFHKTIGIVFILISVFLFISIIGAFFRPTIFPFSSFIALFFAPLWLVNLLFLLYFVVTKNRLVILSLILLLAGTHNVSLLYNYSASAKKVSTTNSVKLVSYNTGNPRYGSLYKTRKETFDKPLFHNTDIICLQEFIPENENGIAVLERLGNKINVDFKGVIRGKSSGLSIYTHYEILNFGYLKQEQEDTYALWCHIVTNKDTITVVNVQLQSIRLAMEELEAMTNYKKMLRLPFYFSSIYSKLKRGFLWREAQVVKIKELITSNKYPVILCGDFNDLPSSFAYREITKLLDDAFLKKGIGIGSTYAGELPLLRIDYIMTDFKINVFDYQRLNHSHSDHYPIAALFVPE